MGQAHRRDATRVIYEILCLARKRITKTQLVYGINLNSRLGQEYVSLLLRGGLLETEVLGKGKTVYVLSRKGERLLDYLVKVEEVLGFIYEHFEPRTMLPLTSIGPSAKKNSKPLEVGA